MKILKISFCDECCYFYNEYNGYAEECAKLERVINGDNMYKHPIPEDCPLEDCKED